MTCIPPIYRLSSACLPPIYRLSPACLPLRFAQPQSRVNLLDLVCGVWGLQGFLAHTKYPLL